MSSKRTCQHCGCSEIDTDQARGDAVCTNCGSVLEENIIVSEIQFEENSRGGTSALGQFVSIDGKVPGSRLNAGFSTGLGRESRAITLENGRKKIVEIAEQLRLNQHCIETAFNFYKMMVTRRLTRGRKMSHVIAACVYIVCRTEGTPHMLLDLSDIVQVNVYELGKTYLRLATALCINIPAIDPCIYIMRFAHKLEFGDKTHEVSMTALRLVQRMKRDWMHCGRRPSGLCGAALLVASRLHNFNRTVNDIIKVVKVGVSTLRLRLTEFGDTPTSRLTLEEFMNIDLEEEQDPPAFKAARRKHKLQMLEEQNKVEEVTSEISRVQGMIEKALRNQIRHKGRYAKLFGESVEESADSDENSEISTVEKQDAEDSEGEQVRDFLIEDTLNMIQSVVEISPEGSQVKESNKSLAKRIATLPEIKESITPTKGPGPTAASLGLKESIEECMSVKAEQDVHSDDGELDITGLDDDEIDSYLMNSKEIQKKTVLWNKVNADYMLEQKLKEEKIAKEQESQDKSETKKKKRARRKNNIQANTAGEAIEKMLQEKKISNKINYDVLRDLNCDSSATKIPPSTPVAAKIVEPIPSAGTSSDNRFKRKVSFSEPTSYLQKKTKVSVLPNEAKTEKSDVAAEHVVVENGPVQYNKSIEEEPEEYEDEEEEEGDNHLSALQLLRQHTGNDGEEYSDQEDYLD